MFDEDWQIQHENNEKPSKLSFIFNLIFNIVFIILAIFILNIGYCNYLDHQHIQTTQIIGTVLELKDNKSLIYYRLEGAKTTSWMVIKTKVNDKLPIAERKFSMINHSWLFKLIANRKVEPELILNDGSWTYEFYMGLGGIITAISFLIFAILGIKNAIKAKLSE